jgi:hypothetical protein
MRATTNDCVLRFWDGAVSISMGSRLFDTWTGDLQFSKLKVTKTTRPLPKCPPADLGFGKVRACTTHI